MQFIGLELKSRYVVDMDLGGRIRLNVQSLGVADEVRDGARAHGPPKEKTRDT
jgi:hypothetical protein